MALMPFDDRDGSIWINGEMVPWRDVHRIPAQKLQVGDDDGTTRIFQPKKSTDGQRMDVHMD